MEHCGVAGNHDLINLRTRARKIGNKAVGCISNSGAHFLTFALAKSTDAANDVRAKRALRIESRCFCQGFARGFINKASGKRGSANVKDHSRFARSTRGKGRDLPKPTFAIDIQKDGQISRYRCVAGEHSLISFCIRHAALDGTFATASASAAGSGDEEPVLCQRRQEVCTVGDGKYEIVGQNGNRVLHNSASNWVFCFDYTTRVLVLQEREENLAKTKQRTLAYLR